MVVRTCITFMDGLLVWPDWVIYCTLGSFSKPVVIIIFPTSPIFKGNFIKGVKIFLFVVESFWATFIDIWWLFTGHTAAYWKCHLVWRHVSLLHAQSAKQLLCRSWQRDCIQHWRSEAQPIPSSKQYLPTIVFFKWANPGHFFIYFRPSKHTLKILQQIGMWKNVHPVYGARIQTHNLWNMSLLP